MGLVLDEVANMPYSWTSKSIKVHYMPSTIGISHLNDGTVPDVITLNIVNEDSKNDGGMCEILTGIGGAIAGSVNGVDGGIFSLSGLACGYLSFPTLRFGIVGVGASRKYVRALFWLFLSV